MKNILLTGVPGIGKTTIIRKVTGKMKKACAGFYTEEIREKNRRVGFRLITTDGNLCILSHKSINSPHQLGKYRISIECIEAIGVTAIKYGIAKNRIIVIDEIGKMELFSYAFKEVVVQALDSNSCILGSILFKSHPFCKKIKEREDVDIMEVTEDNRDHLPDIILGKLGAYGKPLYHKQVYEI